jgi:hypothetical protein
MRDRARFAKAVACPVLPALLGARLTGNFISVTPDRCEQVCLQVQRQSTVGSVRKLTGRGKSARAVKIQPSLDILGRTAERADEG